MQSAATETLVRQELLFALALEALQQDRYDEEEVDGDGDGDGDARGLAVADLLLTVARAERLLQPSTANESAGLLGLTPATLRCGAGLDDEQQLRALEETAQLVLLPRIERKLRLKCSELCDIVLPGLVHATQHHELPALLLEAQAKCAQLALESRQLKAQLRVQLQQDVERCRAMAEVVAQLLREHKRDEQARVLLAKLQWLAAFSRAMRLKAHVLASQLAVETYAPERVAVLQAAHEELQARRARALEERDTLRAKLQLYQSADVEYQSIAREFGAVLLSIEEKRSWLHSLDL